MIPHRQRTLLALLDALGGEVGNLDFQKLLFLYCIECESQASYEFVPFRFGAFSHTSYADRRKLVERGWIEPTELSWKLTSAGKSAIAIDPPTHLHMLQFASDHKRLRGKALMADAYRRHPYYAIHSEVADSLLAGDKIALNAIRRARPARAAAGLLTLGYEGKSLEGYLNTLIRAGVTLLCDVRRNPLSRKYGFSKKTLSLACQGVRIQYEHLPELGIASEERRELISQSDYDALFDGYETDYLPHQGEALSKIMKWIAEGQRVALTCYEHEPQQCHRHCVAEAIEARLEHTQSVLHL